MRVAFCLFRYFPFSGLSRDMLRIAECVRARGHEVSIFTSDWQGQPANGFRTEILPVSGLSNHGRAASYHRRLQGALKGGYDAVVGFNKIPHLDVYYAADACYAARARYNRHPLYRLTPRYRGYRRLENSVFCQNSDTHILVLGEHAKSEFQEFYGTQDARFTLLPPTLQEHYRNPAIGGDVRARVRADAGLRDEHSLILMVGSGFRTKGVDRAIKAVAALPSARRQRVRLVIVGKGKPGPFMSLANAYGVTSQVLFLGGRNDIPELMSAADILLHPAYNENTGAVLLEAMAMGLPVLTTGVCGYARYVAAADAGRVLESPFSQTALNGALDSMLCADMSGWRRNGPRFTNQPLLFSMPNRAAETIERVASDNSQRKRRRNEFIYLSDQLHLADSEATLDSIMSMPGEVYRRAPGRRTLRIVRNDTGYFIKVHSGVGWREIIKNLVSLKLPVLGAQNEWHALHLLSRKGVRAPYPLGFGTRGHNPARIESFVIMQEIRDSISLERLLEHEGWSNDVSLRRNLISSLARIARVLHLNGVNHRDFYLCHFLVDKHVTDNCAGSPSMPLDIVLIDLHRAQLRRRTPARWIVKDLGGLYYSAMHINLSRNDLFRFIKAYCEQPLRAALEAPIDWNRVRRRALGLHRTGLTAES
jgi:UDP-glucose:(heptosyl)LPS alpha-1,3-glucosyltransferase